MKRRNAWGQGGWGGGFQTTALEKEWPASSEQTLHTTPCIISWPPPTGTLLAWRLRASKRSFFPHPPTPTCTMDSPLARVTVCGTGLSPLMGVEMLPKTTWGSRRQGWERCIRMLWLVDGGGSGSGSGDVSERVAIYVACAYRRTQTCIKWQAEGEACTRGMYECVRGALNNWKAIKRTWREVSTFLLTLGTLPMENLMRVMVGVVPLRMQAHGHASMHVA